MYISRSGLVKFAGSWDLRKEGLVYGLAMGPYGTLFALTWDRDNSAEGGSRLLLLHGDPSKPLCGPDADLRLGERERDRDREGEQHSEPVSEAYHL